VTRLRFIADNPRGPRGGNHDVPTIFKSPDSARRNTLIVKGERVGRVLVADLDALLVKGWDHDVVFQWHDRRMQFHASEMMRMRESESSGVVQAKWLTTDDLMTIREVVSEWEIEEDRLRRGGGATPAAARAFFTLRELWREGKFGGRR
jgi:hypothetical protein